MGRREWRRTWTMPLVFTAISLLGVISAVVLLIELRSRLLPAVFLTTLALATGVAVGSGITLPTAIAFDDRGVRLRYLGRREGLMWEQILHIHVVPGSVLLETSHRTIDLGSVGASLRRDLVAEARRRGRKVRADMPEDYVPPPDMGGIGG